MTQKPRTFTSVEICAGAGGQAVGLHNAGFRHKALIEIDKHACETLELNVNNHPDWEGCQVLRRDLKTFDGAELALQPEELDLLAGGVPCPPFSAAGKQLGESDERDLFPETLRLVKTLRPKAVMIENVRGLLHAKFDAYRQQISETLSSLGYTVCMWTVLEARDFGVPQLRPRAILVALKGRYAPYFDPAPLRKARARHVTVFEALEKSMRERFEASGREGAEEAYERWAEAARKGVAPTLVGGSKKHGGADLGPTRAKREWRMLGVDAMGVADDPMVNPDRDLFATDKLGNPIGPKLTVKQAAIIQGFPEDWLFAGRKTAAYRQVGNAFPPPVAEAVGRQIHLALSKTGKASMSRPQPSEQGELFGDRRWEAREAEPVPALG